MRIEMPMCAVRGNCVLLDANVSIENKVKIGNNCVLFSGSRIGTDGFGYAPDSDGSWSRFHKQEVL